MRRFFPIISIFVLFLLVSCTDSSPSVSSIYTTVIFDYPKENTKPDQRLSIYALVSSNYKKADKIILKHNDTNLEWICDEPRLFSEVSNRFYVGYSNFVFLDKNPIPQGNYKFLYQDFSEQTVESNLTLIYPSEYLNYTSSDFPKKFKGAKIVKIAIYNDLNNLIYYSEKKANWQNDSDILKEFYDAKKYRTVYCSPNNKIVCLMPFIEIKSDFVRSEVDDKNLNSTSNFKRR